MNKPANTRIRPKTMVEAIYLKLARECDGCCLDNGPELERVAKVAEEAVRELLDDPGPA
jgi:hypothetical protein